MAYADRQVDVRTRYHPGGRDLSNPNNILRPGQFARIRAVIEVKKGALVIPQRAVTELQGKYLVAVIGPGSEVKINSVKPGARFGQLWVIDQGLEAGQKVVAEGTQKVRDGMVVNPKPFGAEAPAGPAAAQTPESNRKSNLNPNRKRGKPPCLDSLSIAHRCHRHLHHHGYCGRGGYLGLPIASTEHRPPEIVINTTYVGADAQTVEQSVATPIEQEMSGVDNMNYMYSLNANNGELKLYVNFDVNTDPNIDQVLTQIRKSQADSKLPQEVRNYGVTVKKSTASPLMMVSLYSPEGTYDATFLANYAYINPERPDHARAGHCQCDRVRSRPYAMRMW